MNEIEGARKYMWFIVKITLLLLWKPQTMLRWYGIMNARNERLKRKIADQWVQIERNQRLIESRQQQIDRHTANMRNQTESCGGGLMLAIVVRREYILHAVCGTRACLVIESADSVVSEDAGKTPTPGEKSRGYRASNNNEASSHAYLSPQTALLFP